MLGVIAFIPIWVGVTVIAFVPLANVVAVLTAAALVVGTRIRLNLGDLLVVFLVLVSLAPLAVGRLSVASAFGVLAVWVAGYLVGRLLPTRLSEETISTVVLGVFSLVAALAVVEFATGWHGLASWGPFNSGRLAWGPIQSRSGLDRAEGAFGHSIALGASLAMAVALSVGARVRPSLRLGAIFLMVLAVAATLSRISLLCAFLGIVLSATLLSQTRLNGARRGLAAALAAGLILLGPSLGSVFADAGEEASTSTSYRGDLISLLPHVDLLGYSDVMQVSASGTLYFGGFRSIDSELILLGLSYGWLTLGLAVVLLALATGMLVAGRGSPAIVAVVAQIPALAAVALITQYSLFFWFVVGLAVASPAERRPAEEPSETTRPPLTQPSDHQRTP